MSKTLRVYACGGAGVNIGKQLEKYHPEEAGFAKSQVTYIDTSTSNMGVEVATKDTYLFQNVDGSGKVRKENADLMSKSALDVLQRFEPADFNVIVMSASGGTGNVIGATLARHLIEAKHPTVIAVIGTTFTHIELMNTINTLKSLEAISKKVGAPINIVYAENSEEMSRKEVNDYIVHAINDLRVLFSGQNAELDTADLQNWLNYQNVSTQEPKLTALSITSDLDDLLEKLGNVMSVAILSEEGKDVAFPCYTEYRCTGYPTGEIGKSLSEQGPLYFILSDGIIPSIYSRLKDMNDQMEKTRRARVASATVLTADDSVNDDGLVL